MLDVHIADSFEDASRDESVLGIEFEVHRLIAKRIAANLSKLPILSRVQDFFADTKVCNDELSALSNEIGLLEATYSDIRGRGLATLGRLKIVCEQAQQQGKHVYFLAD